MLVQTYLSSHATVLTAMAATPQTKGDELLSRVVRMDREISKGAKYDDFTIQRLKREIDTHLERFSTDKEGRTALAIFHSMRRDARGVDEIERLIKLYPGDPIVRYNAAVINLEFGHLQRARSHALYCDKKIGADLDYLDFAIRIAILTGDRELAQAGVDQWQRQKLEVHEDAPVVAVFDRIVAASPDIDMSALGQMMDLATQILREEGFEFTLYRPYSRSDEESEWLICPIQVHCDRGARRKLDRKLTRRLADTDISGRLLGSAMVVFASPKPSEAAA